MLSPLTAVDFVETIVHIFFPCDKICTLWDEFSLYINRKASEMIGFHVLNIIFGKLPLTCHNKVINLLFLKRTNP